MDIENLVEIRQQAEQSVADMRDGELKVKAFEVLLSHLLRSHDTESNEANGNAGVNLHPKKQATKRAGAAGSKTERILSLKNEDFFKEQRTIREVREELGSRGWHYPLTALSGPLQELVQRRELRRQKLPDGNKKLWKYSNP
jgi:hypothetical protein